MVENWYMHAGIAFVGNGNNRNLQCNIHCARSCKKMLPVLLCLKVDLDGATLLHATC